MIYHDDEWKNARSNPTGPTRAQEQARVDADYALRKMSLADWRIATDELSDVVKWGAEGRR